MRLGRRQSEAPTGQVPVFPESLEAEVTELRSVEQMRVCPECLVVNSAADDFCTGCGARLPVREERSDPEEATKVVPAAVVVDAPTIVYPPVSRSAFAPVKAGSPGKLRAALVLTLLLAVVGSGSFAYLWQSEKAHRHRTIVQRDAARAGLAETHKKLATTLAALTATRAISNQRKAVLLRAQMVLAKVDPLLSDADGIKQVTGQIQSARDTFANDSGQMTSDLLYLENVMANPQDYPGVDTYSLVNQVNSELYTVRSDYGALTTYDGQFSNASTKFSNHATAFTNAVRQLDAELRRVAK